MISKDRMEHMFNVGLKMKQLKHEFPNICDATEDELFILGLLHDFGKVYEPEYSHNTYAGLKLKDANYKYWHEIYNHGNPNSTYISNELNLLNYADMTIDIDGTVVSIEKRLKGIKERYGEDSITYKNAVEICNQLIKETYYGK